MSSKSSTNYNYIDNKGNRVLVYPAINPEIISYIAKVQGEKEKIDNPTNFQSQNPKLINSPFHLIITQQRRNMVVIML